MSFGTNSNIITVQIMGIGSADIIETESHRSFENESWIQDGDSPQKLLTECTLLGSLKDTQPKCLEQPQ